MKKSILFLTVVAFFLIIQKSDAQVLTPSNTYTVTGYLGWDGLPPGSLPFCTTGFPAQMTLSTSGYLGIGNGYAPSHMLDVSGGDISVDISSGSFGYMIDGSYALVTGPLSVNNILLGFGAGAGNSGTDNTFAGGIAGYINGAGYNNTYIGYEAGGNNPSQPTVNDVICLGNNSGESTALATGTINLGDLSITNIYANTITINTYSDRRIKDNIQENVPGLAFINKLRPVTYNLNIHKQSELMGTKDDQVQAGKYDIEKITQSGFIAQQVDSAAQACGYNFNGINRPKTPNGLYALGYTDFVVPLVKAVQELNTQKDSIRRAFKSMQTCLNQFCAATGNSSNGNSNLPTSEQRISLSSTNAPILYQNTPNPFNAGTKIYYYLPEGTTGASIVFYDSFGNPIKTVQISQTGSGALNITPENLINGIYSYSLIVNNNVINTQRMVLQK